MRLLLGESEGLMDDCRDVFIVPFRAVKQRHLGCGLGFRVQASGYSAVFWDEALPDDRLRGLCGQVCRNRKDTKPIRRCASTKRSWSSESKAGPPLQRSNWHIPAKKQNVKEVEYQPWAGTASGKAACAKSQYSSCGIGVCGQGCNLDQYALRPEMVAGKFVMEGIAHLKPCPGGLVRLPEDHLDHVGGRT